MVTKLLAKLLKKLLDKTKLLTPLTAGRGTW